MADIRLSDIGGMSPATVAVLEEGGYRTLNDIIDLERDDFLRLPGIAPAEADRIMSIIDELTTEDAGADGPVATEGQGGDAAEGAGDVPRGVTPLGSDAPLGGERRSEL